MADSTNDLLTYLTDSADLPAGVEEAPRVGDLVELRLLRGGREIEAWSPRGGRRLGRLPAEDRDAIAPLLAPGQPPVTGSIAALVPRPRHAGATGRIHVRLSAVEMG
jgi:hypothetical protein